MPETYLDRVFAICTALPEVTDAGGSSPTFKVSGKTFLNFADNHHGDGNIGIWCKAPPGAQGLLVDAEPARFFIPPYVGPSGWVGMRVTGDVDWHQVAEVIADGWRCSAPAKLKAAHPQLDGLRPPGMDQWQPLPDAPAEPEHPALARLRDLCLSFPEAAEVEMWGYPAFKVRGKTFANWIPAGRGAERVAVWLEGPPGAQELLTDAAPREFFGPRYLGSKGWLGAWLDGDVDWARLSEVVADAYRSAAPAKLAMLLDGRRAQR